MKKFICRILLFAVLLGLSLAATAIFMPPNKTAYLYMQRKKMERLDTLPAPRLVIVGGSNTAFGVDSRILQDSLGLNVANTGLHSGIGLRFMIDEAARRLRCGDIVLIMPEYAQFIEKYYNGQPEGITSAALYSGFKSWHGLDKRQLLNIISGIPGHILINSRKMKREQGFYSALNFNEFGDEDAHWEFQPLPSVDVDKDASESPVSMEVCFDIADKIKDMRQQGITVFLLPQISIDKNYRFNKRSVTQAYNTMRSLGTPFSLPPDSLIVADSLAYDSPNHVSRKGVLISTGRIIRFLKSQCYGMPTDSLIESERNPNL